MPRAGTLDPTRLNRRRSILRQIRQAPRFTMPPCAQCGRPLFTRSGLPYWEILEGRFVCLNGCNR